MKRLPFLLIYSRMTIAVAIAVITLAKLHKAPETIVILMAIGLLTDILDGIIARKLGVATRQLRVWDSNVDQFFWLVILACIFSQNVSFIKSHYLPIVLIAGLEATAYLFSFLKFRRTVATHSWLAKLWTLTMFAFLADLSLHSQSSFWFKTSAILGIVSRLEILLIIFLLKEWTTDVPSVLWMKRGKRNQHVIATTNISKR